MINSDNLRREIARLRKNCLFQTNLFLLPDQLEKVIAEKDTIVNTDKNLVVILEMKNGFYRLHYCASTPEDMAESLKSFLYMVPKLPIVADIVNRPHMVEASAKCLEKIGFHHIETLIRMYLKAERSMLYRDDKEISWATEDDAIEIEKLLYQTFNIYVSRLPSREEIIDMLSNRQILVARDEHNIAGMTIFKPLKGEQVLLDQLLVQSSYRGQGIGANLLQTGIARLGKGKTTSLWSIKKSVSFYERYGFECEGRTDYILLFEGEKT